MCTGAQQGQKKEGNLLELELQCELPGWVLGILIPYKNSEHMAGLSLQIMISVLKHHTGSSAEGIQWGNGDREIRKETDLVRGKS